MQIVWDGLKASANIQNHGVSFAEAQTVFDDPYALVAEDGLAEGEQRFKMLGTSSDGQILVVVYSYRDWDETIRIISSWKAAKPAQARYDAQRP